MSKLDRFRELLPWKRKDYRVLDEYKTSDPREGNQKVLAQMLAHGADLNRERHVIHYLYFPSNDARDIARAQLHDKAYKTKNGIDYGDVRPKSLIAERSGLINQEIADPGIRVPCKGCRNQRR